MPYGRLFYHVVWTAHDRIPMLDAEAARAVERSIHATCDKHRAVLHAMAVMPDRVHLAISIPPSMAISIVGGRLKSSSSHLVNHARRNERARGGESFAWKADYGACSFSEKALSIVAASIAHQETRPAGHRWDSRASTSDQSQPAAVGFVASARGRS